MTAFGAHTERTIVDLAAEGASSALYSGGIERDRVEALYLGNFAGPSFTGQNHLAPAVGAKLGLAGVPCTRFEAACASSGAAFAHAWAAVAGGLIDLALIVGVEQMTTQTTERTTEILASAGDTYGEVKAGATFPALFAMIAARYFHEYGATRKHLAAVAVKNHGNGLRNPRAHLRKAITMEQALAGRPIADPLTLYDCSLISDGAAAVLIGPSDECTAHPSRITSPSKTRSGRRTNPLLPIELLGCDREDTEEKTNAGRESQHGSSGWRLSANFGRRRSRRHPRPPVPREPSHPYVAGPPPASPPSEDLMTDRVSTLLAGRRERLERLLGRRLSSPAPGPREVLPEKVRSFLMEEAEDLYWNELEWENITDEEALEEGALAELAFPGFLAFVAGVAPHRGDARLQGPGEPPPRSGRGHPHLPLQSPRRARRSARDEGTDEVEEARSELGMTSRLIDLVLYRYHDLSTADVERVEAEPPRPGLSPQSP